MALRNLALVLGLPVVLSLRSLHDQDESIAPEPSVVIAGIGDSGTTAVINALHEMGLQHCGIRGHHAEPPWGHLGRSRHIRALLKAGNNTISRSAYMRNATAFEDAKSWLREVAQKDYACIQHGRPKKSEQDVRWGFKEPHYAWLLPVMDEAFHNRTRYLLVARDPRDICTNDMQDQFDLYSQRMGTEDCYEFWAAYWSRVLDSYESELRFAVVRIEDLVVPDPAKSAEPLQTVRCMVEHIGMAPDWVDLSKAVSALQIRGRDVLALWQVTGESAEADTDPQHVSKKTTQGELKKFHEHSGSYMGHHFRTNETARRSLVEKVAQMTSTPVLHETMRRLGYDPSAFVLSRPTSKAVLCRGR